MFVRFDTAKRPPDIPSDPTQTSESLIWAWRVAADARRTKRTIERMERSYREECFRTPTLQLAEPKPCNRPRHNLAISRGKRLRLDEPKDCNQPMAQTLYPRYAELRLIEALEDSPIVLIHGPRQCGKTTLARVVGERIGYHYVTFDDEIIRGAAMADPAGFVAGLADHTILDEVQHVPALFTALKAEVDR